MTGEYFGVTPPADSQTTSLSPACRALAEFATRSPATQADVDYVMRVLVSYDGWYAPVSFAERGWGQTDFDQTIGFADGPPTKLLSVFTDHDAAMLAHGRVFGPYGGPVPGVAIMRALSGELDALIVNPASPREHQWYIAAAGFEIAAGWANAVAVERALAERGNGPVPTADLLRHRYQVLYEQPSRALAQIQLPEIEGPVGVCFTATDRAEEFVASLPLEARPLASLVTVDGPQLFDLMRGIAAAGLVVNAGSDDQAALTRDDIAEILDRRLT